MIIILDVSAAIEILLKKSKEQLFDEFYKKADWIISPDLYVPELCNVLWKYYKSNIFTHEECNEYIDDGIKMIDDFVDSRELWKEVISESIKNNHSVYDMFYMVLARRNDALLLTNDNQLSFICKRLNIDVIN